MGANGTPDVECGWLLLQLVMVASAIAVEECPILDDVAVTSLDYLHRGTQILVKNTSPNATATLRLDSCNSSGQVNSAARDCNDQTQDEITLTASTLGGRWNHLLSRTKEMNVSDTTMDITVVTAGTMLDIFMTSKRSKLKVVNSTDMLWTMDCDPREQVKVDHHTEPNIFDESTINPAQVETTTTTPAQVETTTTTPAQVESTTTPMQVETTTTTPAQVETTTTTTPAQVETTTTLAQPTDILTDGGNNVAYSASACLAGKQYWKCMAILFIVIFFILLSFIVGIFIYTHLKKRRKSSEVSETYFFVDKSENSDASQSVQPQTSHIFRPSNVQILNSDSIHKGCSSGMSRSISKDEENGFPRKYPSPSSLPPSPTETQDLMSSKTLKSLVTTVQESSNNKEDDNHDYDYLDINVPSVQLQTSHTACSSNALPLKSNSIHIDRSSIKSRTFSNGEKDGFPMKYLRPTCSPPPPPMNTLDSMFSKTLESLDEPSNNEEDDEHEYDYMDITVFKQQLDKDNEDEKRRQQTEEERKKVEEERKRKMEAVKVPLSSYDSENSLYEPFNIEEARATLVNEK